MDKKSPENTYLQQVLEQQEEVARQLRKAPPTSISSDALAGGNYPQNAPTGKTIDYRMTGFWLWRSVVVPPNVYVVHTRRGHSEPIHIGRGISFGFNPLSDAFLIIPSSVQTILINANCICIERQGILVQAYLQWMIEDIKTAYWKLDFSDPTDPMGIVNLQLKEQAEAAIKDKVATMSIDEVLSDKQPIIEELTHRLRTVAEGSREENSTSGGLGLKIVTVQIKEAVVSSTQLWHNLQAPFRAERGKLARLAELENQKVIQSQELENNINHQRAELSAQSELEQLRAEQERRKYDREQSENRRRHSLEQEAERQKLMEQNRTAKARNEASLELALQEVELEKRRLSAEMEKVDQLIQLEAVEQQKNRAEITAQLELDQMRYLAENNQKERELVLEQQKRAIDNDLSESYLKAQLMAQLPEIAQNLPTPQEQRTIIITGDGKEGGMNSLLSFLASALSLTQDFLNHSNSQNLCRGNPPVVAPPYGGLDDNLPKSNSVGESTENEQE